MDKAAILIELKKARDTYKAASISIKNLCTTPGRANAFFKMNYSLKFGFCHYFQINSTGIYDFLINELEKDLLEKSPHEYWYKSCNYCLIVNHKLLLDLAILPRLDHLQRTINRLENELKTNQPFNQTTSCE